MAKRYAIDPIKLRHYPAVEAFKLYYELEEHLKKKNRDESVQGIAENLKPGEERTLTKNGKTQIIRRLN